MNYKMFLAGFAALAAGMLPGATTYTVENTTNLVATVAAGETNAFDSAYATALNANTYTAFVKRGEGGLVMPDNIASYMGSVTVEKGSLGYTYTASLGSLAEGNGDVTVVDGATLYLIQHTPANDVKPWGKRFVIAGFGVNGAGAINLRNEEQGSPFGTNVVLTGDTRVRNRTQYFWAASSRRCGLDMNGHTLFLYSEGSSPQFSYIDISHPGNVVIENFSFGMDGTQFGGTGANVLVMTNNASMLMPNAASDSPWTLKMMSSSYIRGSSSYTAIYNEWPGVSTNVAVWKGPVSLTGPNLINFQSAATIHGGGALLGKVSGSAPFRVWGNSFNDGTSYHHPYLNLVCPENDFTGKLTARFGGIRLWNPGAIGRPSEVALEEGEIAFDNLRDDFGNMPDLTVNCGTYTYFGLTVPYTNEVRFGRGKWKSVTKTGDEKMWWYSGTGSDLLDVKGGQVKFGRRAKIAGLYSSLTNAYSWGIFDTVYASGAVPKTDLEPGVRSPNHAEHAYQNYTYKLDPNQVGDSQYAVVVYRGYIWNNDPTNVIWSFAGGLGRRFKLTIGDATVFEIDRSVSNVAGVGSAVLKPGPNLFDFRGCRSYRTDYWQIKGASNVTWPSEYFNFGYKVGEASTVQSDYRQLEDPGDGSILTFCLPDAPIVYPGHESVTNSGVQADFALMKFADGAGLDLEGLTNYVAASIQGFPTVTNATDFAVTNLWTVPVAGLGTKQLVCDGRLDLSKATIAVDDIASFPRTCGATYLIGTAAGGIVGTPSVYIPDESKRRFRAEVSGDFKSVFLAYEPAGTTIIFR